MLPVLVVAKCDGAEKSQDSHVKLHHFSKKHNLSIDAKSNEHVILSNALTRVSFTSGARRVTFNNLALFMNGPSLQKNGEWLISVADAENVFGPMMDLRTPSEWSSPPHVILDPGHGGDDTGARGQHKTVEKRIALDIAKRVQRILKSSGTEVALTRRKDHTLELGDRPAYAMTSGGTIFVSIHLNSSPNGHAHGIETYVLPSQGFPSTSRTGGNHDMCPGNTFDSLNSRLSYFIQKELLQSTQAKDRGIRRARWKVLRDAPCPAVLVECGFLSNPTEAKKLSNRRYRDRVAQGIADGILTYINTMSEN